jgi:hypothetical protein
MSLAPRVLPAVAIPVGSEGLSAGQQAHVVLDGLEQAGDSFELRLFLNDPDADATTATTGHAGYAGSIHVYGYGHPPEGGETQQGAPRLPMTRRLNATQAIAAAAAEGQEMTVTLVPVAYGDAKPDARLENVQVSVLVHE